MMFVSIDDGNTFGIFGLDTEPGVEGCWEPISNYKTSDVNIRSLQNIGITHYSKK